MWEVSHDIVSIASKLHRLLVYLTSVRYSTKGRPAKANLLSYIRRVPTSTFPQHNQTYQMHDDTRVELRLWDNLETFPDISPLYYDAHTILICFNIGAPASLENVKAKVSAAD